MKLIYFSNKKYENYLIPMFIIFEKQITTCMLYKKNSYIKKNIGFCKKHKVNDKFFRFIYWVIILTIRVNYIFVSGI